MGARPSFLARVAVAYRRCGCLADHAPGKATAHRYGIPIWRRCRQLGRPKTEEKNRDIPRKYDGRVS